MSDAELLAKVKTGMGMGAAFNDPNLQIKTIAVKQFMLNAGITQELIESDLGVATLTIGVTDLWNLSAGEIKFSDAFLSILMPQLMVVSLPDV